MSSPNILPDIVELPLEKNETGEPDKKEAELKESEKTGSDKELACENEHTKLATFEEIEGIIKKNKKILLPQIPNKTVEEIELIEADRVKEWIELMTKFDFYSSIPLYLKKKIRKGIPDSMRQYAWLLLNDAGENGKKVYGKN